MLQAIQAKLGEYRAAAAKPVNKPTIAATQQKVRAALNGLDRFNGKSVLDMATPNTADMLGNVGRRLNIEV